MNSLDRMDSIRVTRKRRTWAPPSFRLCPTGLWALLVAAILSIGVEESRGFSAAQSQGVPAAESQRLAVAERLGDGIVRFFASEESRAAALPSLALFSPRPAVASMPAEFPVRPVFQQIAGRNAVRIEIEEGTSLYGTGEVPGPLLRNGRKTTAWNHDAYGYGAVTPHLYQSHPWVLAVRADGTAFGVLADTAYRCHIDLTTWILFVADGPSFPVIVIDRDSPQAVLKGLAELVGTMPLPPKWTLGYHQCRYSYYPEARVREIAAGFRARDIPCDVLWYDIDYMDGFRSFTWNAEHFPDPAGLNADLHAQGFHTVAIIDPGIKKDRGYFVYDTGTENDAWVKTASGEPYVGDVWPGRCVFPDFTNETARRWWGDLYADFLATGIDAIWNDMNEPAIFNVDSKTMPLDNVHAADEAFGGPGPHARFHNVYGMLMARATREGMQRARPGLRPFVLTRANHLGGHRYAATWTGDNLANWYHLDISIPMVLNLGLSGQPFAGPDIGGFGMAGTPMMFARWMGFGALLPFARGHTGKGNIDKEPWAFGPEVEQTCRVALQRRYRLLPYLYTVFRESSRSGLPVMRPLFFADPTDPALRAEDDAFLLGADLMVIAQVGPETRREPARPQETWRLLDLGLDAASDPDLPELYVRGGSIVPVGPVMQHVDERALDPLELVVCLSKEGTAVGWLYEDDGVSQGHLEGDYRLVRYDARLRAGEVEVLGTVVEGNWPLPPRQLEVRVLLEGREVVGRGPEGAGVVVTLTHR